MKEFEIPYNIATTFSDAMSGGNKIKMCLITEEEEVFEIGVFHL